jgi:LytR cell envelope-related transcriptional attenuator
LERNRRGRVLVLVLIALGVAGASLSVWWHTRGPAPGPVGPLPIPGQRVHAQVEVLNTTASVGLARAATRVLRDAGINVVYFGSDTGATLDTTQVLVRRGAGEDAPAVARALGVGVIRQRPDPSRLVDITVRLGRDFAARLSARHP